MYTLLTPVLFPLVTVLIQLISLCLAESVSQIDLGKSTSRAEISSSSYPTLKAVNRAHIGAALHGSANLGCLGAMSLRTFK